MAKRKSSKPATPGWPGKCPESPAELRQWLQDRIRCFDAVVASPEVEGDWRERLRFQEARDATTWPWNDPTAVAELKTLCGADAEFNRRWMLEFAERLVLKCHQWGENHGTTLPDLPAWVPIKPRRHLSPADFAKQYLIEGHSPDDDQWGELGQAKTRTSLKLVRADLARLLNSIPSEADHSDDFRSVKWHGETYSFSKQQAAFVKILWEHWERGTPDVGSQYLLERCDSTASRITDVFKRHNALGIVIVPGRTKGSYRLQEPKG